jgi:hypothetical protein
MSVYKPRRIVIATLIAILLTVAAATKWSYLEGLVVPGIVLAQFFCASTVHEAGIVGVGASVTIIWLSTFLVWSLVAYGVLSIRVSRRGV